MKTHNRILFHCLCCGRVVHAEPAEQVPTCCGKSMTKAAAETVVDVEKQAPSEAAGEAGQNEGRNVRRVPR